MAVLRTGRERDRLANSGNRYKMSVFGRILATLAAFFVVTGFIVGIYAGATSSTAMMQNTAQAHRVALVQYINDTNPAIRRQAAAELVKFDATSVTDVYGNASWNDHSKAEVKSALKHVAATGDEMKLAAPVSPWHRWRIVSLILGGSVFLLWGMVSLLTYLFSACYSSHDSRESRFLVDLPYRQIWPVAFLATCTVGWPFFLVSAFRYHAAKSTKP